MRSICTSVLASTPAFVVAALIVGIVAGTSSASGGGSASASASAPQAKLVTGKDVPSAPSEAPKPSEWKDAQIVSTSRGVATDCRLLLLRGWLRAECKNFYGVSLVAGDPHDVHTVVSGVPFGWDDLTQTQTSSLAVIELPLAVGRSYIATFLRAADRDGYGPAMPAEGPTLHVAWEDVDADPTLILSDPRSR